MRNSKYCYIHSFLKFSNVPWHKNSTYHVIATILLALLLFYLGPSKKIQDKTYKNTEKILKNTLPKQLDQTKIFLAIRYAYEFENYQGATNTFGNENRIIDPNIPLRQKYNPNESIKFVFGISNQNQGMPFDDVYLEVIWPDEILEVKEGEGWQAQNINKRYTYHFPQINNLPLNTYSGISAKFPGPGKYTLLCFINGRGISKDISCPVKIELY